MIDSSAVQNLVMSWWFDYDQGNFDVWPEYFTADAHFSCRTDTGTTNFEDFVNADVSGRDALLAWQIDHRKNSPYPLRHNGTNIHVTNANDTEAEFRSYIFVTQIVEGAVSNLGGIDILVNCAGIFPNTPVVEMPEEEWDEVFAVNHPRPAADP